VPIGRVSPAHLSLAGGAASSGLGTIVRYLSGSAGLSHLVDARLTFLALRNLQFDVSGGLRYAGRRPMAQPRTMASHQRDQRNV
jgi:hypothetical protein